MLLLFLGANNIKSQELSLPKGGSTCKNGSCFPINHYQAPVGQHAGILNMQYWKSPVTTGGSTCKNGGSTCTGMVGQHAQDSTSNGNAYISTMASTLDGYLLQYSTNKGVTWSSL